MKKVFIILMAVFVAACSQFGPFEDMRREAGQVAPMGRSSDNEPAICYNPLWHNEQDLQALADAACARTKRKAVFQDSLPFSCRLVNPSTAVYKCQ